MRRNKITLIFIFISALTFQVLGQAKNINNSTDSEKVIEQATFGMGCFWCSEAIFQRLKGVIKVESGYSGGKVKNPSYELVSSGTTGHAEVIRVTFDPKIIKYDTLLEIFWKTHDPTTLNRQGADEGTQYRSVIFYHNNTQKMSATKFKALLNKNKVYDHPIVTQIVPFRSFYKAEDYHQNYYKLNGNKPYCRLVIQPKIDKLEKVFSDKLK